MTAQEQLTDRVVLFVWDGMRPDLISAELTPNLWHLQQTGSTYHRAVGVFPSVTRPTTSSVSTAVLPGTHGLLGNLVVGPAGDRAPLDTADPAALERLRAVNQGRVLPTTTLAEATTHAGKRFVSLGSGSHGQLVLLDPEGVGTRIHVDFTNPPELLQELTARFGTPPTKAIPVNPANDWLNQVFTDYVLPELQPAVVVMWQCEPDASQHASGLGSSAATAAIQGNDARLGRALAAIAASGVPTTVIVASDHGHSTVNGMVQTKAALGEAGFGTALADGQIHIAEQTLMVEVGPEYATLRDQIGNWLVAQPWAELVIAWDTTVPAPAGALTPDQVYTADALRNFALRPTFSYSHAWDAATNEHAIPGGSYAGFAASMADFAQLQGPIVGLNRLTSTHGTFSPYDQRTVLTLHGPGIRQGAPDLPAGVIDLAPTILALLGLPPLPEATGRPLAESFDNGPDPASIAVTTSTITTLNSGPVQRHQVGETPYLESSIAAPVGAGATK